jgi:2-C-methyl-D-erythritol 2,4-cyclodiphosphate synthase
MIRVGSGFDAHRFSDGRKLMIGGVEIPHSKGLRGHSDADVLLHALADALLGAAGFDDIGAHFPDSDKKWKDASSAVFIREITKMLKKKRWKVVNADLTIISEAPKIGPHRSSIKKSVSELLGVAPEAINIKATSTDQMGATGRGEGIAAQAVVLIERKR